ncbi:hypothetical protein, partial [Marinobacter sp.]|uniref:hypothetical protein n=1 Tax=Marinobacter sp. TaxID=50741 RepID=UPI002B47F6D7
SKPQTNTRRSLRSGTQKHVPPVEMTEAVSGAGRGALSEKVEPGNVLRRPYYKNNPCHVERRPVFQAEAETSPST